MKYEIQIGHYIDLDTKSSKPLQTMYITEDQFDIIRRFANTKIGKNLETTYILNDCEFSVVPALDSVTEEDKKKVFDYFIDKLKG